MLWFPSKQKIVLKGYRVCTVNNFQSCRFPRGPRNNRALFALRYFTRFRLPVDSLAMEAAEQREGSGVWQPRSMPSPPSLSLCPLGLVHFTLLFQFHLRDRNICARQELFVVLTEVTHRKHLARCLTYGECKNKRKKTFFFATENNSTHPAFDNHQSRRPFSLAQFPSHTRTC